MDEINKKFFYKRDYVKTSKNIKNLKIGDIITFYGKLFHDKKLKIQFATTIIKYKIIIKFLSIY